MKHNECCNGSCNQGRACPARYDEPAAGRRFGPSIWRTLFGWLLTERRSGQVRRQQCDNRRRRNG